MYTQLLSTPRPIFQRQHQIIQISKSSCILKTTDKKLYCQITTAEVWLEYFVSAMHVQLTSTHDHGYSKPRGSLRIATTRCFRKQRVA